MKNLSKLNEKKIITRVGTFMTAAIALAGSALADGANFTKVAKPIIDLLNSILGPLLAVVVALGALYCVILGVKFAKAEEPQEREKAKSHLKNAIIGFVIIFVLILALNILTPIMADWVNANYTEGGQLIDTTAIGGKK